MTKIKYYYDNTKLSFEPYKLKWWQKVLRVLGFLSSTLLFASLIIWLAYTYFDSPKEKQLKREIELMAFEYEKLQGKLDLLEKSTLELQDRDENLYRVIFEAEPIKPAIRQSGTYQLAKYKLLEGYNYSNLIIDLNKRVDILTKSLYIQSKSLNETKTLAKQKTELLMSIPAIQPISNKKLKAFSSGFGYRIDPIYKTYKMHTGVDFTAPTGTPVYATGNAKVALVAKDDRGYGNHIILNHGYGYQTLYAHLSRFQVRNGQKVKRGEVIGYIGNTGKSTSPHLHYEVIKDGKKINPINFFYSDLNATDFEELVKTASTINQSSD